MADDDTRKNLRYDDDAIRAYLGRVHAPHPPAFQAAFDAPKRYGLPAIQIAPSEGRTIELLLKLARARKVVEIGTLAGYSALWIARAIGPEGRLWTIEIDPKHAEVAERVLEEAGFAERAEVRVGAAAEVLGELVAEGPFDAVFIDADKGAYDRYADWARDNLRAGGLVVADNAFFFGKLLDDDSADAAAMRRMHEHVAAAFDSVCLPTPDGMVVGIRRG